MYIHCEILFKRIKRKQLSNISSFTRIKPKID